MIAQITLAIIFFPLLSSAFGQEDISKAIHQTILKNLKAGQAEDLPAMMKTIHSQSPVYQSTKERTPAIFKAYNLDYRLLSYKYIGRDGDYAFARTRLRTRKISGPALRDNVVDTIQIFRKEKGEWKLWNQAILEIHYLK
jgi:ketosteroid isomerase-like protein